MKYEGLDGEQAEKLAGEAFPGLMNEPEGGPPRLAAGQRITGYPTANAATVDLGNGEHGVIVSSVPMALQGSSGQWVPVDLGLHDVGGAFEPARPLVGVRIPTQLGAGVSLPASSVALTPVDGSGAALGGSEGIVDGAVVLYTNTSTDADTLVKPVSLGFAVDTLLRSNKSPQQLSYRIGMPQGATLVESASGSGAQIVDEGTIVASLPAPTAHDAAGAAVPVSMQVSGDLLTLTVNHPADAYQYPIDVDPEVKIGTDSTLSEKTWIYNETAGAGFTHNYLSAPYMKKEGTDSPGQRAEFYYKTEGVSKIYKLNASVRAGPEQNNYFLAEARVYLEFEGTSGYENSLVLDSYGNLETDPAELCASASGCPNSGGAEHNLVRVADEITATENGGNAAELTGATVSISEPPEFHATVSYNTTSPEIDKTPNVLYTGGWMGPDTGAIEFTSEDNGIGVSETALAFAGYLPFYTTNYLWTCAGIQCAKAQHEVLTYERFENMPPGEQKLVVSAHDAIEHTSSSEHGEGEHLIKLDGEPPYGLTLTGLPSKGGVLELGEVEAHVRAEATDGEAPWASSGVRSIALGVDGKEIGQAAGSCPLGPCTASAEWSLNGAELGVGTYTLTVVATDNVGNVATKNFTLHVYHASPVPMGPGSLNPESGDFALEAADVAVSGGSGSLAVTRHYDSRNLKEGEEGPLGPQWTVSLGSLATLEVLPDGSVMVIGPEGLAFFKAKTGGGFEAPVGDSNLTLEHIGSEYLFKDSAKGTTTKFTQPSGAKTWMPTVSEDRIATDTTTDTYVTAESEPGKKIVEPKLELAPHASASCPVGEPDQWEKACHGLEFVYGAKTKENIGENESEWGEYKDRLMEVKFIAYEAATKAIVQKKVAKYEYDNYGRLRAEWDPEISPALKLVYGYDSEGHVTAITPPGEESYAFTYGTIPGDLSSGRLLKVTRARASAPLWSGSLPMSTGAPHLTGTPVVGERLAVSNGTWSGEPVVYGYQWEDCEPTGRNCTPIPGAGNANYTPVSGDVNHALVVLVTATNGGGSVVAASTPSSPISSGEGLTLAYASSFGSYGSGNGQFKEPVGLAVDGSGNVWVADWANSRFQEFNSKGEFIRAVGSHGKEPGQIEGIEGITVDTKGNVWVSEYGNERVDEFTSEGAYVKSFGSAGSGEGQFNTPGSLAVDSRGNVFVADRGNHRVEELNSEGKYVRSFSRSNEKEGPFDVQLDANGDLWVSYAWDDKVAEFSPQGSLLREWGTRGTGAGQLEDAYRLQVGPEGNIWLAEWGNNRVQVFSQTGEYRFGFGTYGSGEGQFWHAQGIGFNGTNVYVVDSGEWDINSHNRIEKWEIGEAGELHAPQPGATIEYNVALAGVGLPTMTSGGVTKWGQKDEPVYATAIFPPDEPQSWPATDYRRASISYLDSSARAVNAVSPSGGVATQEYDEGNQVTRSLSAESRATALKEGCESETKCKSAEVAKLLDTENAYNSEEQLTDTWGPQHTVRLAVGKAGKTNEETLARNHLHYYYDEGAKEAEEKWHESYGLVTKTTDGAETASKEEFDKRTVTTSYSGQGDLGWKLRMPTSTTTDPGGLNLTSTTLYEEGTGNIIEMRGPAASGGNAKVPPSFGLQFGGTGSEDGKLNHPMGDATDTSGNLWVVDSANNRVQKFSGSGAFIAAYGKEGTSETELQFKGPAGISINQKTGDIYVGDQGNNRIVEMSPTGALIRVFGKAGAGSGEFKEPDGVAIDSKGEIWVADSKNNRIQKFNEEGKYLSSFGELGTTCGKFSGPAGIAISGEDLYVTDAGNSRVEEFNEEGKKCLRTFGSAGTGTGQFVNPTGIAIAPSGNVYVSDSGNARVEEFTAIGAFLAAFGVKGTGYGQFAEPQGLAFLASGAVYVDDAGLNNRVQQWLPAVAGNVGATELKTVYYTAKGEAEVAACREHPEWVGLVCQTKPVTQPGISGLPELPVTTVLYNVWNQAEKTEEAFGSTTRTKKTTYDGAGRPLTSKETSSNGASMPTITDTYNATTGILETKSDTVGESTKTLTSKHNTLGQLETYTDAEGKTTTFEYEKEGAGRIVKVTDAKGSQTYTYDETSGALTELVDSTAGRFTATFDGNGRMASESYPNGMTAYFTYNPAGETNGIEYKKLTHCTEKCTWFSDTIIPSIHGETLKQTSTLAEEPSYTYDADGRLTQVQELPAGEGCKTRIYAYDENSDRTSETTREPGTEGKCASEDGGTEWHTYDTASSLSDREVAYDAFGDTTKLPASDAGGSELVSEYYLDGQVSKQEQDKEKIEYKLDPEERTLETVSSGNTAATVVSHYDAPGGTLAWSGEGSGETEKWTRNIGGIGGGLTATQKGEGKASQAAVLLLHDLQGNVVGEAEDNETATKLLKTYNSTEFGVPNGKEPPPTYAWLGAAGVASELPSGVITQDGITYVPQTGRPLQTEGVAIPQPGNAAAAFTRPVEAWVGSKAGEGAARELSRAEQERQEREAASPPPGVLPDGNPGWWCGEEYACAEEEEGCSGTSACAASVNQHHHPGVIGYHERGNGYAGCSVWASYGSEYYTSGISGEIEIVGHWKCKEFVPKFEMQIALLVFYEEKWVEIGAPYTHDYFWEKEDGGIENSHDFGCGPEHLVYDAWVFGRQYDGSYKARWWSWGREAEYRGSCHGRVALPEAP